MRSFDPAKETVDCKFVHFTHIYIWMIYHDHNHPLHVSRDSSGQQQTPTETQRHQTKPRQPKRLFKDAWRLLLTLNGICWCLLVSFCVCWCLLASYGVWRCEEGVWGASERVSECCLWTCLRFGFLRGSIWVFRPCLVQLALYWKISEKQNSTHLAFLKHQNTKTSLYKLSKNHWVITLLEIFGSVRRKLQSTVSLDHPVITYKQDQWLLGYVGNHADWLKQNSPLWNDTADVQCSRMIFIVTFFKLSFFTKNLVCIFSCCEFSHYVPQKSN